MSIKVRSRSCRIIALQLALATLLITLCTQGAVIKIAIGGSIYKDSDHTYNDSSIMMKDSMVLKSDRAEVKSLYGSLPSRRTWISNSGSGTFMESRLGFGRSAETQTELLLTDRQSRDYGDTWESVNRDTTTMMSVSENITDGQANFRVLQAENSSSPRGRKNMAIDIDDTYIGSFKIDRTMAINTSDSLRQEEEYWLECCPGNTGWSNHLWNPARAFDARVY